jgi:hypothetical protein
VKYQVPQNIDLEDKIIGPLTLIQFLYILGAGVIDYLLFMVVKGGLLFWVIGIPIALFAIALAFLKIQDQPLMHFVKAGFIYLQNPKKRIWQRRGLMPTIVYAPPKVEKKSLVPEKRKIQKSELEKLAQMLDTRTAPKT